MLADKLDHYKGKNNKYVDDNIKEIQEIYMEEEQEKRGTIENEEVILIRPYEVSSSTTSTPLSITKIPKRTRSYVLEGSSENVSGK